MPFISSAAGSTPRVAIKFESPQKRDALLTEMQTFWRSKNMHPDDIKSLYSTGSTSDVLYFESSRPLENPPFKGHRFGSYISKGVPPELSLNIGDKDLSDIVRWRVGIPDRMTANSLTAIYFPPDQLPLQPSASRNLFTQSKDMIPTTLENYHITSFNREELQDLEALGKHINALARLDDVNGSKGSSTGRMLCDIGSRLMDNLKEHGMWTAANKAVLMNNIFKGYEEDDIYKQTMHERVAEVAVSPHSSPAIPLSSRAVEKLRQINSNITGVEDAIVQQQRRNVQMERQREEQRAANTQAEYAATPSFTPGQAASYIGLYEKDLTALEQKIKIAPSGLQRGDSQYCECLVGALKAARAGDAIFNHITAATPHPMPSLSGKPPQVIIHQLLNDKHFLAIADHYGAPQVRTAITTMKTTLGAIGIGQTARQQASQASTAAPQASTATHQARSNPLSMG